MNTFTRILTGLLVALPLTLVAAEQTATLKVDGSCGSCKKRIVKAAESVQGVKDASWDKKTKVLTAVYDDAETTPEAIGDAVLKAGYDVEGKTASAEAYDKLPDCCQYRSAKSHD